MDGSSDILSADQYMISEFAFQVTTNKPIKNLRLMPKLSLRLLVLLMKGELKINYPKSSLVCALNVLGQGFICFNRVGV